MSDDTRHMGRNTRLFAAAFCPHCQFSFVPQQPIQPCPKCGSSFKSAGNHVAQTELHLPLESPESAGSSRPTASLATEVDELIGQQLGVYTCDALLGAGAMGRVYLARHRDLHRKCALKILPPSLVSQDPAYVARFMNEGQAAARISGRFMRSEKNDNTIFGRWSLSLGVP
jgi:serine/threonine protein kinase